MIQKYGDCQPNVKCDEDSKNKHLTNVLILRIIVLILLVFSYFFKLKIIKDSDQYFKHFVEIKDYSVLVNFEFEIQREYDND